LENAEIVMLEDKVKGYTMRTHGGFPAVFEGPPDSEITVDVFDMRNLPESVMSSIDSMEFGCGYFRRLELTESGHEIWMYVMPADQAARFPYEVASGDWNQYEGEQY
jgi:gamma-glutamylcyclotransferase (GGCT)/AIG2-like uncharacterized protein YtfP